MYIIYFDRKTLHENSVFNFFDAHTSVIISPIDFIDTVAKSSPRSATGQQAECILSHPVAQPESKSDLCQLLHRNFDSRGVV